MPRCSRSSIERDNPFSPGGEIDKESREILKYSVIKRDHVLIVDPSTPSHVPSAAKHRGERGDDDGAQHRVGFREQRIGAAGCSSPGSGDGCDDTEDVVISIAVPTHAFGKDAASTGSGGAQQQKLNGLCDDSQAGNGRAAAAAAAAAAADGAAPRQNNEDIAQGAKRRRMAKGGKCGSCLVV